MKNRPIRSYKIFNMILLLLLFNGVANGQEDSLTHYLQVAGENNRAVQVSFNSYQAALQKIPQAGAFQDPKLDIGFFLKPMDIVGGKQVANFTLMQMFPWFGTRRAARSEATHRAKMAYEQFREVRNTLFLQVYTQWYKLLTMQQQLNNNRENLALLSQTKELATQRFIAAKPKGNEYPSASTASGATTAPSEALTSGGPMGMSAMGSSQGGNMSTNNMEMSNSSSMGSMSGMGGAAGGGLSEVIRIEIEMVELENNIESLELDMASNKAAFNLLLNRDATHELAIPNELTKLSFEIDRTSIAQIKEHNPMLAMYLEEELGYRAMGKMQKKMSYPMIGVGLQYMLMNKTDDPMLGMGSMNGKDMVMPMVSISIPIFRGKYRAQQRESKLLQQAAINKYENTLNTLEGALIQAQNQLESLERKINLYSKQTVLAETSYQLALKEYTAGQTDLTSLISIHRQLLTYKLKTAEAIATYNTQVVTIQKLGAFNTQNFKL